MKEYLGTRWPSAAQERAAERDVPTTCGITVATGLQPLYRSGMR
jgi:hypothetical protein